MIRPFLVAGLLALGLSNTAHAQERASPLATAFLVGVRACVANVQGKLPLNPPSTDQTAAGLVLADPTGQDELKAFSDLSPRDRLFASVISNGIPEEVIVASDSSQSLCRVVVFDAKDISPVVAAVGVLNRGWSTQQSDPLQNFTVYGGALFGAPKLTIRTRQPPNSGRFGTASYMLTVALAK